MSITLPGKGLVTPSDVVSSVHWPVSKLAYGIPTEATRVSKYAPLPVYPSMRGVQMVFGNSTTPGTPVLVNGMPFIGRMDIRAYTTNAGLIVFGDGAIQIGPPLYGLVLEPGDFYSFDCTDEALLYFDVETSGDGWSGVCWSANGWVEPGPPSP